jgi:epoxide hydrolase
LRPFAYHAPQAALDDLHRRLEQVRWPERETVADGSQGVPLARFKALVDHWLGGYDWRRCEQTLNSFDQYVTEIDGLNIHFLHVRSPREDALPMIITHGWPSSVTEFFKVLGPLSDPAKYGRDDAYAFHLVAPSLPGYGFSGKPTETGWNVVRTARAWHELMRRLGYQRYIAQGGNWGAFVATALAQMRPPELAGIHLNLPLIAPNPMPRAGFSDAERKAADALAEFWRDGSGYLLLQGTRPQTIGYALADSPVAQAAWVYEKFCEWGDTEHAAEEALTLIREQTPDVAVVDISLEDAHGLDLVHNIRSLHPDVQVVVFSMYDETVYAERAIRAGAVGYLMKSESTRSVVDAIRSAIRGEIYLSKATSSRILHKMVRGNQRQPSFPIDDLKDREMAVFQMLGQGFSVREIEDKLNLSRKTVETYRRRVKEKLGFETVAELLQFAVQWTYGQSRPK